MPDTSIRVWTADPRVLADEDAEALVAWLDVAERRRLATFRFQEDANAFLLVHAMRRALLCAATGRSPDEIAFVETDSGQPLLAGRPGRHFSHSRSRACVAFAVADVPVGVDVEPIDAGRADFDLLVPFLRVPPQDRSGAGFFAWWTALEAFWKAAGTGLADSNPMLAGEMHGDVVSLSSPAVHARQVRQLRSIPGCIAAVATEHEEAPRVNHIHCSSAVEIHQLVRTSAPHEIAGGN